MYFICSIHPAFTVVKNDCTFLKTMMQLLLCGLPLDIFHNVYDLCNNKTSPNIQTIICTNYRFQTIQTIIYASNHTNYLYKSLTIQTVICTNVSACYYLSGLLHFHCLTFGHS